ncbi:hypothetical protein NDU88_002895 [Pleurodeles waltl]|uniref:Uncharacterized protein n=1 Tax=Pleurodeles waltl TaxID=8319 RepID=A0AAV7SEC0_PLEWA|nr:hypothetical protein NDU88_002895 [Pleurodeles waltl]
MAAFFRLLQSGFYFHAQFCFYYKHPFFVGERLWDDAIHTRLTSNIDALPVSEHGREDVFSVLYPSVYVPLCCRPFLARQHHLDMISNRKIGPGSPVQWEGLTSWIHSSYTKKVAEHGHPQQQKRVEQLVDPPSW